LKKTNIGNAFLKISKTKKITQKQPKTKNTKIQSHIRWHKMKNSVDIL
jgi:hypothetical protein